MNIYAPDEFDPMFFREIVNIIAGNSKGILIIGGDFNEVQDGKMDKIPIERGSQCPKTKTLNNFMSKLCHVRTLTHGEPETQKGRISVFSPTYTIASQRLTFSVSPNNTCIM